MLTVKELNLLLPILHKLEALEAAAAAFQRTFVRSDHFRIGAALVAMMEDGLLPIMRKCGHGRPWCPSPRRFADRASRIAPRTVWPRSTSHKGHPAQNRSRAIVAA